VDLASHNGAESFIELQFNGFLLAFLAFLLIVEFLFSGIGGLEDFRFHLEQFIQCDAVLRMLFVFSFFFDATLRVLLPFGLFLLKRQSQPRRSQQVRPPLWVQVRAPVRGR